jgi:hypothetical protein
VDAEMHALARKADAKNPFSPFSGICLKRFFANWDYFSCLRDGTK